MADVEKEPTPQLPRAHKSILKLLKLQNAQNTDDGASKQINLTFSNLTVTAPASTQRFVKTLPTAILRTFGPDQLDFIKWIGRKVGLLSPITGGRPILSDFTGIVEPGEMLFLLGQPGSGCSTLLRTLANRGTLPTTGNLSFGGENAKAFGQKHRRETIYMPEEDGHIAALSVRQTINFALRMSVRSSTSDIKAMVQDVSELLRIDHALDTPVGGQYVQGVSGGERKR